MTANADLQSGLPKEPYTPTIKELSIDYTAIAEMEDIDFVHLYPYENTNKVEDITKTPCLLPTFRDEGTLYIGLNKLQPGGSLNLLFQLAEATADTEQDRADVRWYYLTGNHWLPLRKGFEVIADNTDGLTVSSIVQILVPDDISDRHNTILPEGLFWIRVSAAENVRAVSETIGIHTQAARATALLPQTADKKRLALALPAGSIAKLEAADFSIKKVEQPYASFGGKTPEADGHLYTRVSEHLRHKGRGQMLFDYEYLVMEAFPQVYKVKCISHTMGLSAHTYVRDLEIAPGFVVIAVIPDLTKLIPGNMMEPRAPVSLLEQIADYLRQRISPFARLKVLNPRFEKVDVNISVRLRRGKPKDYYAKQLKTDLLQFLAPWYLGDSEKIAFGQNLLFSDVVKFTESLDYVDFIAELELIGPCNQTGSIIRPLTARSILTGGTVCVKIDDEDCLTITNKAKPEDSANPRALASRSDWECDTTDTFFSKPRIADTDDCMTP
ncbi:MAG: baseplate J/gp47 family protein [Lewinellaceae bacterium]|nr:baseplate J/gp47 family protein [Lewinellaceae bacterium]